MFRNSLKMLLGGKSRKAITSGESLLSRAVQPVTPAPPLNSLYSPGGGSSVDSEGSDVRTMEGLTRSLPSSPHLNYRTAKTTGMMFYHGHTSLTGDPRGPDQFNVSHHVSSCSRNRLWIIRSNRVIFWGGGQGLTGDFMSIA